MGASSQAVFQTTWVSQPIEHQPRSEVVPGVSGEPDRLGEDAAGIVGDVYITAGARSIAAALAETHDRLPPGAGHHPWFAAAAGAARNDRFRLQAGPEEIDLQTPLDDADNIDVACDIVGKGRIGSAPGAIGEPFGFVEIGMCMAYRQQQSQHSQ